MSFTPTTQQTTSLWQDQLTNCTSPDFVPGVIPPAPPAITTAELYNNFHNSNQNYVNFSQFMMQHNLFGIGGVSNLNQFNNNPQYHNTNNIVSSPNYGNTMPPSNLFNQNLYSRRNMFSNDFPTYLNNTTPSNNYQTTTTATVNTVASSNLQASAPEFIPQFNKLTLKETQNHQNTSMESSKIFNKSDETTDLSPTPSNIENHINTSNRRVINGNARSKGVKNHDSNNQRNNHSSEDAASSSSRRRHNYREKKKFDERRSLDMSSSDLTQLDAMNLASQSVQPNTLQGSMSQTTTNNGGNLAGSYWRSNGTTGKNVGFGSNSRHFNNTDEGNDSKSERERDRDKERDRRYQKGKSSVHSNRSNKRRDDWNRNRDRINGYRVEEKFNNDNDKESPILSPEKKSPKNIQKMYQDTEKLSQREKLVRDIEMRRLECLVCVEQIKVHHSVWSCNNCYHILHLQCITKWASSSISDDGWRCPACQNVVKDIPRDYYCFCGKLKNPQYNRHDVAHSCAEVCGRIEGCPHACTLLCHPGPCPPCQAYVKRECGCGKTTKTMQCYLKDHIECDATCGKLLNCELHTCEGKCHEEKCYPCEKKVDQTCHCGKQERQVICTRESNDKHYYSCGKACGKDLSCGNHKCKDCCHSGPCKPCKMSPEVVTSCPCGKTPIIDGQRNSCLDPISTCDGVCGKTLRCGKSAHPHHCNAKCHLGNCPPCNKQTAVKCRCGHMDQMIKCRQLSTRADDARCKKRCVKKRSCGKHKCNQECCIDIDHICPMPCNYTLSCGKHKCDQPCHRGNCPPCYRSSFEELYCECGAEVIYPPVPCGTKRPICKKPCSRQHPCSHPPQHTCHSAATCPPCMIFTTKWCFGHHEQRKTIQCSQQSFSCGFPCNKDLPCGRHKCIKPCHEGICQTVGEICKQNCTKLRASCGHKCMAPCHDGDCPDTPCKEMVEVQCECSNRKQMRTCHELAREYSRITTAQLASSMAEMQRGNYMELSEILAPVKMNKTNKTLDCNEECRLVARNRRLAMGLQIRNPDLPQKLLTKYSDFIKNFAKKDLNLVKSIHDALTNLVKLAKESKQKSRSHSFPIMNREKRQLVHEMCEMFGVESVAYDSEPNRNVVATAYKERSWLPATSIMEVMQREAGQRRIPVPSNNAWGIKRS